MFTVEAGHPDCVQDCFAVTRNDGRAVACLPNEEMATEYATELNAVGDEGLELTAL